MQPDRGQRGVAGLGRWGLCIRGRGGHVRQAGVAHAVPFSIMSQLWYRTGPGAPGVHNRLFVEIFGPSQAVLVGEGRQGVVVD